jgi:hypothetical protein
MTLEDVKNLQHQWRADGVEYMKCMEDLDTTLLQGPAHQYFDYDEEEHVQYHSNYKQQLGIHDDRSYCRSNFDPYQQELEDQSDATDMSKSVDPAIVHKRLKHIGLPALSPMKLRADAGLSIDGEGDVASVVTGSDGDSLMKRRNYDYSLVLLVHALFTFKLVLIESYHPCQH